MSRPACVYCGLGFVPRTSRAITCSEPCSAARRAEASRLRNQRARATRKPDLTADDVRALLAYDPDTGALRWRYRPETTRYVKAWNYKNGRKYAGRVDYRGYVQIGVAGKTYRAHRIIHLWMTGAWPEQDIDHADGNPGNNSWSNLRLASASANSANKKRHSNNRVGLKGVVQTPGGRYMAQIRANKQSHYLGTFDCPREAHSAYVEAARKYHGEFARAA
jgi:hypothetical protein